MSYDIPNNAIVILVGTPASGKSTIARKIAKGDSKAIISGDDIYEEYFAADEQYDESKRPDRGEMIEHVFMKRLEERLEKGELVIIDTPGIDSFVRAQFYRMAMNYNRPIRIAIMNISEELALEQNSQRKKKVSEKTIKNDFNNLKKQVDVIINEVKQLPNAKVCDIVRLEREI